MAKTQSKGGRPKTGSIPIVVRLEPADVKALDDFRRGEPDLPTRPEGVRRLLRKATQKGGKS